VGWAKLQEVRATAAKHCDTVVVLPQSTLDAVIEGRNGGIKEWEFQERAGVGQEMLCGSERDICLLVLDSVASTQQWIRQPKP